MNKILFLLPLIIGLLSACTDDVPTVDDPHNIVINGEKMKQTDFIKKYCIDKPTNGTCLKVEHAISQDATKGEVPRF